MTPAMPFHLRKRPYIWWETMNPNDTFLLIIIDVGFGHLNYLAYDYPANTKVTFCIKFA